MGTSRLFYRAANSVLYVLYSYKSPLHKLHPNYLLCLFCETVFILRYDRLQYCNQYCYWKIFGFARLESVRLLREISGYKSIYTIFENSRKTFLEGVKTHHNPVIRFIATLNLLEDSIVRCYCMMKMLPM